MIYKIKNKRYVNEISILKLAPIPIDKDEILIDAVKGEQNKDKVIENETNFKRIYWFKINPSKDKYWYYVLKNELGSYIVREDNVIREGELKDTLNILGIKSIINNGDLTILITSEFGKKYFTKRNELDEFDLEKAIMVLLIKAKIYATSKQISDLVKCVNFHRRYDKN